MLLCLVLWAAFSSVSAHYCPIGQDQCHVIYERTPVIRWVTNRLQWNAKLVAIYHCQCNKSLNDNDQSLLQSLYNEVLVTDIEGQLILFNEHRHSKLNTKFTDNGCGELCATPTSISSGSSVIEMLLNITYDVIIANRMSETHVIGIISQSSMGVAQDTLHPLITALENIINKDIVTIHYIINSVDIMKSLGDPDLSVTYNDGTHFNKASTLRNLIQSNLSDCVQSYLLSKGIDMQISWYTNVKHSNNLNPVLWNVLPLDIQYQNKCDKSLNCSYHCSPLHGCISASSKQMHSNVKPSLADVQFKTTHAEYIADISSVVESRSTELSITQPVSVNSSSPRISLSDVVIGEPDKIVWNSSELFYEDIISKNKPLLIDLLDIKSWKFFNTSSMSYIKDNIGLNDLPFVKCSYNYLTFDPDIKSPLQINLPLPYVVKNMTKEAFFNCIQNQCNSTTNDDIYIYKGYYYFGEVPDKLKHDLQPNWFLYNTEHDYDLRRQYIWISSANMITHGHFDQDYNLFIQLVGTKRFTLWSPSQHELLYMYPRVHPMWHKSRINFRQIDLDRFPSFAKSNAIQVTVGPGEVLYIPPYTWHYVETLSPSVSLSTWSHDYHVYHHMNAIYGHDHKFDLIASPRGQLFTLRLYLDLLIQDLYGFNETTRFFVKLLATRFAGLEHLFPPEKDDMSICTTINGGLPLSYHILGYVKLDVQIIGSHFKALKPELMDILLQDYVEEISAQVVGVNKILAFYRYCFQGQQYYVTTEDDKEHSELWNYIDN